MVEGSGVYSAMYHTPIVANMLHDVNLSTPRPLSKREILSANKTTTGIGVCWGDLRLAHTASLRIIVFEVVDGSSGPLGPNRQTEERYR